MPYVLGVDLGTTYSAAAIANDERVDIFQLGGRIASIPSVVLLRDNEVVLTGEAAERRATFEPSRTAREFKRRLGDPTPYLLGGTPYGAEALTAHLLAAIVAQVVEQNGEEPAVVVLSHPANYGPYKLGFLEEAARLANVGTVQFITEPQAAAVHYASSERVVPGELVAVYDFGGGTLDLAVLRKTADGFELIGTPEGMERFGGIDLDGAVFAHVDESLGGLVAELDPEDQGATAAIAQLRASCREAKEALSVDTDVTIAVMLPNAHTEVRLTRGEFEDMIRPRLRETLGVLDRVVRSAGVSFDDISRVLLIGGASRIPLVAEMVRQSTGRPVAVDAHPKHSVALGAAWVGLVAAPPDTVAVTGGVAVAMIVGDEPDVEPETAETGQEPVAVTPVESSPVEPDAEAPAESKPAEGVPSDEAPPPTEEPEPAVDGPAPESAALTEETVAAVAVVEGADAPVSRRQWRRAVTIAGGFLAAVVLVAVGLLLTRGGESAVPAGGEGTTVATGAEETAVPGPTDDSQRLGAVYHVSFSTPDVDGDWGDWAIAGAQPPEDIAADYYPLLGPYSSADGSVLDQHFTWLREASVGMIVISWHGAGSPSDRNVPVVLEAAARNGISVVFLLEPYERRTAEQLIGDVEYLLVQYGDHEAFFRTVEPSLWMEDDRPKALLLLAGLEDVPGTSEFGNPDYWRPAVDAIHESASGVIVLAVNPDPIWVEAGRFDGLAAGPIAGTTPPSYAWAESLPEGAWFVPAVSPGRSTERIGDPEVAVDRAGGMTYEEQWIAATSGQRQPDLVIINSFNGWATGSQIEPATPADGHPPGRSYGEYVPLSPEGYLDLTRALAEQWSP